MRLHSLFRTKFWLSLPGKRFLVSLGTGPSCHCEERSDETISVYKLLSIIEIATPPSVAHNDKGEVSSLAMTYKKYCYS